MAGIGQDLKKIYSEETRIVENASLCSGEFFFRESRVLTLTCAVLVTVFTLTDRTLISKMEKKKRFKIQNNMKLAY